MTGAYVAVTVHRGARPRGAFPRLWWQRLQCSLLALLEGQEWLLAGSSVLAHPRRLQAPHAGVGAHGDQTVPTAPGEEARPGVRHAALHLGLVLGMLHAGRIDQEAVVAGCAAQSPACAPAPHLPPPTT